MPLTTVEPHTALPPDRRPDRRADRPRRVPGRLAPARRARARDASSACRAPRCARRSSRSRSPARSRSASAPASSCAPTPHARRRARRDDGPGPFELLAARSLIEGEIAAAAARLVKRADLDALRATLDEMRDADDDAARRDARRPRVPPAHRRGDAQRRARARRRPRCGTSAAASCGRGSRAISTRPKLRARTLEDHAAIVDALGVRATRTPRATAMHRHLARVAREFQRRWDVDARRQHRRRERATAPAAMRPKRPERSRPRRQPDDGGLTR